MPRRKKGVTFRLKKAFLSRFKNKDVIVEFYLPRDCPSLCAGCTTCFLKDQNLCKDAAFVQKIGREMLGGLFLLPWEDGGIWTTEEKSDRATTVVVVVQIRPSSLGQSGSPYGSLR